MTSSVADALRVLVVDDDSALIRTLSDILRMHGYAPSTAGTGHEGLAVARDLRPALAVVDLRLPDMDGIEVVSRLRQLSELTEVVVLTGNASVESAIAALREHSVDYLVKPVQVERLLHVVSVAGERWHRRNAEQTAQGRARQQAAVARFGQRAVGEDDIPDLLHDAATLVAETLELPLASVLERRADGSALALRAGSGWEPGALGAVVPLHETQAGQTLSTHEPIIVTDLEHEPRFRASDLLRARGVRSGMTVVIPGPIHPFGVLAAHDRDIRSFTQDDVHFLQAIAHIIGSAVERTRTEAAFRQAQRLEAVGQLAGGVAHDFNNMLSAITGYAELARMSIDAASPAREDVEEIIKAATRAAGLTRQLLAFSRRQVLEPRRINVADVVSGIEGMLRRLINENIVLRTRLASNGGFVNADPGQLEQVVVNLAVNARDAMPNGGTLTIETALMELDDTVALRHPGTRAGDYVMLAVSDTGTGMDSETRARMFEPFFTTKPADKGTGLGLATVYGIVKQSGGEIWVYSEVGEGTVFKVFLPRVPVTSEMRVPAQQRRTDVARGSETLLLAEDEEALRRLTTRILTAAGYTVLVSANGEEALRVAREHRGPIHLLVTDMIMPVIGGHRLAEELRALRPEMRVLYLSGYTDTAVNRRELPGPGDGFLQKPFTRESLAKKVRALLDAAT